MRQTNATLATEATLHAFATRNTTCTALRFFILNPNVPFSPRHRDGGLLQRLFLPRIPTQQHPIGVGIQHADVAHTASLGRLRSGCFAFRGNIYPEVLSRAWEIPMVPFMAVYETPVNLLMSPQ